MIVSFVTSAWETVYYEENTLLELAETSEAFEVCT